MEAFLATISARSARGDSETQRSGYIRRIARVLQSGLSAIHRRPDEMAVLGVGLRPFIPMTFHVWWITGIPRNRTASSLVCAAKMAATPFRIRRTEGDPDESGEVTSCAPTQPRSQHQTTSPTPARLSIPFLPLPGPPTRRVSRTFTNRRWRDYTGLLCRRSAGVRLDCCRPP